MKTYRDKIRVICHSLKMTSLAGVDPNVSIDLSTRIKSLPSPEKISSMGHNDLVVLSGRIERLLFDIGNSKNSRTVDFAIRHRTDKGIPPRLAPVLAKDNWLTRAASEEKDWSRHLHPNWEVIITNDKIGEGRVFRLTFSRNPILDFVLTRQNGKYDGNIKEIKKYPLLSWIKQKGIRPPMIIELFSKATNLLDYGKFNPDISQEDLVNKIRNGEPMPKEE